MSEKQHQTLKLLGNHIKNIRLNKGMTQIEVSAKMNRDQQSLQRVESGRVNPSFIYLLELSDALEIHIGELVTFKQ